jgi:hypothetical protein
MGNLVAAKRQPYFPNLSPRLVSSLTNFISQEEAIQETAKVFNITPDEVRRALAGNTFYVKFRTVPPPSIRRR